MISGVWMLSDWLKCINWYFLANSLFISPPSILISPIITKIIDIWVICWRLMATVHFWNSFFIWMRNFLCFFECERCLWTENELFAFFISELASHQWQRSLIVATVAHDFFAIELARCLLRFFYDLQPFKLFYFYFVLIFELIFANGFVSVFWLKVKARLVLFSARHVCYLSISFSIQVFTFLSRNISHIPWDVRFCLVYLKNIFLKLFTGNIPHIAWYELFARGLGSHQRF